MNRLQLGFTAAWLAAACACARPEIVRAEDSGEQTMMQPQPGRVALACQLDAFTEEEGQRHAVLLEEMRSVVSERRELPDGYALRLPAEASTFVHAAEWITLEHRCCPFLDFALQVSEADGVWLHLTGPPGVKELLASELPSPER